MQTRSDTSTSCPARSQSEEASKRLRATSCLSCAPQHLPLGTSPVWPYRQLILVTPHASALPLLDHSFDVHQHRQRHTAGSETEEQRAGAEAVGSQEPAHRTSTLSQIGLETILKECEVRLVLESFNFNLCVQVCAYMYVCGPRACSGQKSVVKSPGTIGNEL